MIDDIRTINVYYWSGGQPAGSEIPHNVLYPYSKEKRNEVIDYFLDRGFEVMIRKNKEFQIILVDVPGGKFRQR